jgi:hypothetical protein
MQYANYAATANAANTYNCTVLAAAQQFAQQLATAQCTYSTTVVQASKQLKQALKNDTLKNESCFATRKLRKAVKLYKNEQHFDALHSVCTAMLQRSYAYQIAFT